MNNIPLGVKTVRKLLLSALLFTGLVVLAKPAQAVPISGILRLDGGVNTVTVTAGTIVWSPDVSEYGIFTVSGASTGSFFPLIGTTGSIHDLESVDNPAGPGGFPVPADGDNFMLLPNIAFDLRIINFGSFSSAACFLPPAAGQDCSLPGTPFDFHNDTVSSSTVSMHISGLVRNIMTGELSTFSGLFSATFPDMNFQDIIAALDSEGSVTTSYSGTFVVNVTPIPEPASLFLLGTGLVGAAVRFRKSRRNAV